MTSWTDSTVGDEIELAYGKSLPAHLREHGPFDVFGSNGRVGHHTEPLIKGPGIVVGRKGSVGEVVYSLGDFWPIDTTYYVVNKSSHDWRFLFYLLSDLGLTTLNSHSAVPGLNREDVYSIAVRLPPRGDEDNIASALDLVQHGIAAEADTIDQAQTLKYAAMRTFFARGLHVEPQKETGIGFVPDSWSCVALGDIAEIAYGAQAAVANATDPKIGTLILTNVNLNLDGHIDLEKRRYYKIPSAHRDRLSLRKGDVLFNWRSGSADHVGKTVYFDLDEECTYSSFILRFRPYKCVTSKYLFRWLTYLRVGGFFTSQRNVSSINSVYNASLSATIPVWFPEGGEQAEIVGILDAIDSTIDLHRRKRTVLTELSKALLHKLTTGELGIGDLDLSALETKLETTQAGA